MPCLQIILIDDYCQKFRFVIRCVAYAMRTSQCGKYGIACMQNIFFAIIVNCKLSFKHIIQLRILNVCMLSALA